MGPTKQSQGGLLRPLRGLAMTELGRLPVPCPALAGGPFSYP